MRGWGSELTDVVGLAVSVIYVSTSPTPGVSYLLGTDHHLPGEGMFIKTNTSYFVH